MNAPLPADHNVAWLRMSAEAWLLTDGKDSIRARHLNSCADEIERLQGELEAAEQHVKILTDQRDATHDELVHTQNARR